MGNEWNGGTKYVGTYGTVWWATYQGGRADDSQVIEAAHGIRRLVDFILTPETPSPDYGYTETWPQFGYSRVVVWDGGRTDRP